MKTSYEVYKRLRDVKFRHLTELLKTHLKRRPENCRYNRAFRIESDSTVQYIRLCFLHQPEKGLEPHLLDICQEIGDCASCNAYVCRYTKEDVKALFEEELRDPKVKAKKYPAIFVLEWVLDQEKPTNYGLLGRLWMAIRRLFMG